MSVDLLAEFGPGSKSVSTTEAYKSAITSTTTSDQNQQSSKLPTSINKSYNLANDFTDPLSGLTRRLSSQVGQAVDVLQLVDATAEDAIDDDWGEFECAETNPEKDQYLNLVEVGIQSSVNQNSASEKAKSGYHAGPTESLLLKDRVAEKKPVERTY